MLTTVLLALPLLSAGPLRAQDPISAWSEDALFLVEAFERLHPAPWFGCPRAEFETAMDAFLTGLEGWDERRAQTEFMRLFATLSAQGRDGHSGIWPMRASVLPLKLYGFSDGWFVVASERPELVGAQLVSLGGVPIDELCARLAPLLTRDNEWNLRGKLALALATLELLEGVGVESSAAGVRLELVRDGKSEQVELAPSVRGVFEQWQEPALPARSSSRWLSRRERAFRLEVLERERALYVQYNEVTSRDASGRSLADFTTEVTQLFVERKLERLVIDVRSNGGGDNTTFAPLIAALRKPPFDRHGVLFALTGRGTYSAAGNFVTALERDTRAILIGEPTGGAPNQYGDAQTVELPNHQELLVRISTRYHEFSRAEDQRLTHEPHLAVPFRAGDYFADRDPVLAAALEYAPPK